MAAITRSIDVDAAIGDVDREWTQFRAADVGWTTADDAERDGVVLLKEIPGGTRVSVTVEFEGNETRVTAHLERDLKTFKAFAGTRG